MEETRLDLPVQEDERVELSFNLRVADAEIHSPQTRSPFVSDEATQEESEIHNIWVLQFADTTSDAALREARYYASAEDMTVIKLIASSTPTRVVVVANTFDPDIAFGHCEDMAEFIGAYKRVSSEADVSFFRAGKYCPPLSAYLDLDKLNVSGGTLDFLLKRIVAKADLTITNATTGSQAVTITSVTVCNVPDKLYFFSSYHLPELFPLEHTRVADRHDRIGLAGLIAHFLEKAAVFLIIVIVHLSELTEVKAREIVVVNDNLLALVVPQPGCEQRREGGLPGATLFIEKCYRLFRHGIL